MSTNNTKNLDKIFGMTKNDSDDEFIEDEEQKIYTAPVLYNKDDNLAVTSIEKNTDIQYIRKSLQSLINRSQEVVEIAIDNAKQGNARETEVAAEAISSAVSAAEKLLALHETLDKIESKSKLGEGNTFVNNQKIINVTTKDLLNALQEKEENNVDKS